MSVRACSGCGQTILFARTVGGRFMPVDDQAHPDGNIRLDLDGAEPTALVLAGGRLSEAREMGEKLHRSHFVTCPKAARFGGRGRR